MAAAVPFAQPRLIELVGVSKEYDTGGGLVRAMRDVSVSIAQGEFVAIVGASGSGKSTMMNILGCLDRPTRGTYTLAGIDVGGRPGDSRAIVRNRVIGFIFQGFNLLPRTTALENVELPLQYRGVGMRERRRRAKAALQAVNLGDRLDHTPNQLSGGQQQRVAIARALVTDPPLLLADEPTGNLDTRTSLEVLALLQRLNRERAITIVLVTHEPDIAACASRVITMRDGRIVTDVASAEPMNAAAALARLPSGAESASLAAARLELPAAGARIGSPISTGVYAMMFVGELAGEAIACAYIAIVLRMSPFGFFWAGRVASEVVGACLGARAARRSFGRPPTRDERLRMAFWYTMAVTCPVGGLLLVASLALRLPPALRSAHLAGVVARAADQPGLALVAVLASLALLVVLRFILLTLFQPRR